MPVIKVKRIRQVASSPANCNPCYPATGEKARFEKDFEFAGQDFIRTYHSDMAIRARGMGIGWYHRYASHLIVSNTSYPNLVDENGYFERFRSTGSGSFRGTNSRDKLLLRESNGSYLLYQNGEVWRFTSAGALTSITHETDPQRTVFLSYTDNQLTTVTDLQGRQLTFAYEHDLLSGITLPDGSQVHYQYDTNENLIAVDYGNGQVRQYHYAETGLAEPVFLHHLTGITAETGQRYATFSYDSDGRVTSSKLHGSTGFVDTTTLDYVSDTQVNVTTPSGNTRSYTIANNQYRRITGISDGAGTTSSTYDSSDRVITRVDARGITTRYTYQPAYLASQTEAAGTPVERKTEYVRDNANRLLQRKVSSLQGSVMTARLTETFAYDNAGRQTAYCRIDPAGGNASYACGSQANAPTGVEQTRQTWCDATAASLGTCPREGLLLSTDGPRTDVNDSTTYTYYASDAPGCATNDACPYRQGDRWQIINALGHVTEFLAYDGAGRLLAWQDANGIRTEQQYTPRGWLAVVTLKGSGSQPDSTTTYAYTATGQLSLLTLPDGDTISWQYDSAQRLIGLTDNLGNQIHYTLDNAGNRLQTDIRDSSLTLQQRLTRVYNSLNRLQQLQGNNGQQISYSYDSNGNRLSETDAQNRQTRYSYDALNRQDSQTDALNGQTAYAYTALDQLQRVTDPRGNLTTYSPNAFGQITQEQSPDTGTLTRSYSNGLLQSHTDARSLITSYSYDALGRLTSRHTGSETTTYSYDSGSHGIGRLGSITDTNSSTQYTYTPQGQTAQKQSTLTGGPTLTVTYGYTPGGKLQSLTTPGNRHLTWQYDSQGRLSGLNVNSQPLLSNITHGASGITGWTWSSGGSRSTTHDLDGRLTQLHSGTALARSYSYNTVNQLTGQSDSLAGLSDSYGHDALDRLTSQISSSGSTGYSYDANGNRTGKTAGTTTSYTLAGNSNRLLAINGDPTFSYLPTGQLTQDAQRSYGYNDEGRLTSVTTSTATVSNRYNALGQRIQKTGSQTLYFAYDEAGQLLGEYTASGSPVREYIWLNGQPVGLISHEYPGTVLHVHTDHLGTPRAVSQGTTVLWRWEGDAFGDTPANDDADGNSLSLTFPLRFPGQYHDAETGLHYNYYRDYNPRTGRYLESDPIGLKGGLNTYTYVHGNPASLSDPLGLDTHLITTIDNGFGTHSALYINTPGQEPVLYDPGGSYLSETRGSGGFFSGEEASFEAYHAYQEGTGSNVATNKIPLTPAQEQELIKNIENGRDPGPLNCAVAVSSQLSRIGAQGISPTRFPGRLQSQVRNANH